LLVEPGGGEDDQLARDDEPDRLGEQHLVAVRPTVRIVEESQLEGEEVGQRDEYRVGQYLPHPVAVDGMVQPAHEEPSLRVVHKDRARVCRRMHAAMFIPTASLTGPIVDFCVNVI